MFLQLVLALASLTSYEVLAATDYNGYKIYDVIPDNTEHISMLHELSMDEGSNYDFFTLTKIPKNPVRVMVTPDNQDFFAEFLKASGMKFKIYNENVEKITKVQARNYLNVSIPNPILGTDRYHSHAAINEYIKYLAKKYSKRVFVKEVGQSFEKRLLQTITVTNGDGRLDKNVIFIDGGFHAREWISPASVLFIIGELVENHKQYEHLLLDYDWVFLPVVNADGYEYSRAEDRLWRKTRRPSGTYLGQQCYGTDPNRNCDFHWNEVGSSTNPCSDVYAGETAFSEVEVQVVRDIIMSMEGRCKMYLTVHSYGSYLLYPWGWTSDLPETWKDLDEVAQAGAKAIKNASGREYTVGSSTNVLYAAAGGSDDFAFAKGRVPISITMELPGGGSFGFNPPESSIDSLVRETLVGVLAMGKTVVKKYPLNKH